MQHRQYHSRFGADRPITFQQYVAEVMLARREKAFGRTLPQRFWERPGLERDYRLQIFACSSLLNRFPEGVIFAALKSPAGLSVYSLRNPALVPVLERTAAQMRTRARLAELARAEDDVDRSVEPGGVQSDPPLTAPRPVFTRPGSVASQLSRPSGAGG